MKIIFLFESFILMLYWSTLAQATECQNPLLHRNQQPMSAIFLELTPLTPFTLEFGFYQIETVSQASNTIIIDPPGDLSASRVILDHERWEQTLRGLNHQQTILLIGLRHFIGSHSFSLGFTEDIDYYSSEDISLLLGWQFSG